MTIDPADQRRIVDFAMDLAREGSTDLLAEYVDRGFPANQPDDDGNTVLMLAAYHGHADTLAMLVERGADVDRPNNRGQSPLAGALFKGEDDVVRVLLAAGADPDAGTPSARETARMFGTEHLIRTDETS